MALLRTKEIRAMSVDDQAKRLRELRDELMHERGTAAMGGAPSEPRPRSGPSGPTSLAY